MNSNNSKPQHIEIDELISAAFPSEQESNKPLVDSKSGRILAATFCIFISCLGLLLYGVSIF